MKRKIEDDLYFTLQNGRSGMTLNANTIDRYINKIPFELNNSINFLDIGCRGPAYTVKFFASKGCNSYGIDIGTNAEAAWINNPLKANLRRADIHEGVPFDIKFDIISISHTLEHCHSPELALSHIHSALKDNGYVWGIVPIEPVDDTQKPHAHYCVFHTHQEHLDMYINNGFEIVWSEIDSSSHSNLWAKKIK